MLRVLGGPNPELRKGGRRDAESAQSSAQSGIHATMSPLEAPKPHQMQLKAVSLSHHNPRVGGSSPSSSLLETPVYAHARQLLDPASAPPAAPAPRWS